MSARDDYPTDQWGAMCDEIDRLRQALAVAHSEIFAWDVLADQLEPFAKEVHAISVEMGTTPARVLRMLVRYGIARYDEANDIVRHADGGTVPAGVTWVPHTPDGNDRRPCTCGHPQAQGVIHRTDGPCFHVSEVAATPSDQVTP